MSKILILSALPEETGELHSHMHSSVKKQLLGETFFQGKIGEHEVVAGLSGIGKVNAAMTAQAWIDQFHPEMIFFTGVAGALNPNYELGDIILASHCFQHDVGFEGETFAVHAPARMPELGIGDGSEPILVDLTAQKQFKKIATLANQEGTVRLGVIATGDQFIASGLRKSEIRSYGGDAVEMEGAAVAWVARRNDIQVYLFRSISDKASHEAVANFPEFLRKVAHSNAELIYKIIKKLN